MTWPRLLGAGLAMLALTGVAGCGEASSRPPPATAASESAPVPSPLPPRPVVLRLDGVDPCALLTPAQVAQLKIDRTIPGSANDDLGSADCLWRGSPFDKPDNGWLARLTLKRGAEWYLGSSTGVQIVQVGGFGAVQTSSAYQNPQTHCILAIDVAPGESLWVQYVNSAGDYPGINHEVACRLARQAAEPMVANLRNLVHR